MKILITGGAGFIGSTVVETFLKKTNHEVIILDALTYAGNVETLTRIANLPRHMFLRQDIREKESLERYLLEYRPDAIIHLAAETHVDRSIDHAESFISTNIQGTFNLLEIFKKLYYQASPESKRHMRFIHVSTDEVYGSLGATGYFTESTPYAPRSPYSASKAASDHLVSAWGETYGIPTIITNCSNNYGPYQYPEKLIPLMILSCLNNKPLPVYGRGENIRDWLFVEDHALALLKVFEKGIPGETYNIGGGNELKNIEVVEMICNFLDSKAPQKESYHKLIQYVTDRPGHDFRYAIDDQKIRNKLGWSPTYSFEKGLSTTIDWYLSEGASWVRAISPSSLDWTPSFISHP